MSVAAVRSWRTAFLTLRDETLASPPRATVLRHLDDLILSQSDSLIAAAPNLPPHEVTSDLMLLMELAESISLSQGIEDVALSFTKLAYLIHGLSHGAFLQMNPTYWTLAFGSFKRIVQTLLDKPKSKSTSMEFDAVIKATRQCLESIRLLFGRYQSASSLSEDEQLLSFLLQVVACFQEEFIYSLDLSNTSKLSGINSVKEVLKVAVSMIGEVYARVGSCLPVGTWQLTTEALRKTLELFSSKKLLVEDDFGATFYIELLNCLHLILALPKGDLAGHVSGLAAALRCFFRYGLTNKSFVVNKVIDRKDAVGSTSQQFTRSSKSRNGPYRPPHLRKKPSENMQHKDEDSLLSSEDAPSSVYLVSSDSDASDSDRAGADYCSARFAKARLAAIICIQDLCRADPKLFSAQWTLLLPSSDVLQHRLYETNLMSCLLFDPNLKVRVAAGSTIIAMLDGPASVSLQVAEFKGGTKCGSFTSLSSSLGHILMQLHAGTLHLIKHESHSRLLALSFKMLMLLTSSTPYSRMPKELLPMVLSSVTSKIEEGFAFHSDRSSLLVVAINYLTVALSVSPASTLVNDMLLAELSSGSVEGQQKSGVLYTLFRFSELSSPSTSLEAFQALKALAHNYPHVMDLCWDQISSIVEGAISISSEVSVRSWRDNAEQNAASIKERVTTAAIKVLDECLRAISGFKGTEDNSNDKLLDSPFTSDYVKEKAISSAPSYSLENHASTKDESNSCALASQRWLEATMKHIPLTVKHSSPMVRAASITCFAGMTSSVFVLLKDKHDFIIGSCIDALNDEVPSVRSAACRTIGVIAFFPQIYQSADIMEKFINAAEHNTHDSLISVRITASWALANICDSLGHSMSAQNSRTCSTESTKTSQLISKLFDSALWLAKDNDKVKANAVRALGNLSCFVQFTDQSCVSGDAKGRLRLQYDDAKPLKDERPESFQSSSSGNLDWLVKMVQAFLSCVSTGNVKVQWNVCHALSNLFSNKTLKLEEMDWSGSLFSILLLLLRDSSNFKIKIQAASALAVPESINDYGSSYYDVVKGVENIAENFKQISEPSNFKYRIALEKQLTSTMLHLLGLAGRCNHRAMQEFLTKKASFLEAWMKNLCVSLGDTSHIDDIKHSEITDQKKNIIRKTIHSLIDVYESCNQHPIAQRFNVLANIL